MWCKWTLQPDLGACWKCSVCAQRKIYFLYLTLFRINCADMQSLWDLGFLLPSTQVLHAFQMQVCDVQHVKSYRVKHSKVRVYTACVPVSQFTLVTINYSSSGEAVKFKELLIIIGLVKLRLFANWRFKMFAITFFMTNTIFSFIKKCIPSND